MVAARPFLLFVASLFPAMSAAEGKPAPKVEADFAPMQTASGDACYLGYKAQGVFIVHYVLPPDDVYLTLVDPDSCDVDGSRLTTVHAQLYFQVRCTQTFEISVVGVTGDSCPRPDPSQILCGPVTVDFTPTQIGTQDVTFELPAECVITGRAFLSVSFAELEPGCSTTGDRPALVTNGQCQSCASYNFYPGGQSDLCEIPGFPGRPIMYVESEAVVPVLRSTWGNLKTRYR
jgi:hypothetical protein